MPAVSVQQAAVTALATYLQGRLNTAFGDGKVKVMDRWPEPDQRLVDDVCRRAITITFAGEREDMHVEADVVRMEAVDAMSNRYWWRMKACRQPLQLDLFGLSDVALDELKAELDEAIHQGPAVTLGIPTADPVSDGITLRMPADSGHYGTCAFCFDGPSMVNDGEAHRVREYRALVSAYVDVDLAVVAVSPKLALLEFQAALDGATNTYTYQQTGAPPAWDLTGSTEG